MQPHGTSVYTSMKIHGSPGHPTVVMMVIVLIIGLQCISVMDQDDDE